MPDLKNECTVMAFDYGTRRIGVAVGNTVTQAGQPIQTITENGNEARFRLIESLIREWQPDQLVVGLP